jgi:hypothetical protein
VGFTAGVGQYTQVSTPTRGVCGVCGSCRASLDDALESHVSDAFPDARYAVYAAEPAGVKTLTACVSSAKFNAANFWNGRWRSVWTATLSEDQTTWAVAGTFKVCCAHPTIKVWHGATEKGPCFGAPPAVARQLHSRTHALTHRTACFAGGLALL